MLRILVDGVREVRAMPDIIAKVFRVEMPIIFGQTQAFIFTEIFRKIGELHPKKGPWYARETGGRSDRFAYYNPGGTSGRYRKSLKRVHTDTPNLNLISVYSETPYAQYVEYGTRPHEIRPRLKKVLRWIPPSGITAFRKKVQHPGFLGDHIFEDTFTKYGIGFGTRLRDKLMQKIWLEMNKKK